MIGGDQRTPHGAVLQRLSEALPLLGQGSLGTTPRFAVMR